MKRPGQYADSGMNQSAADQMQHVQAQRLQHDSGMGHYPGRRGTLQDEVHQYMSKPEEQWLWDGDRRKGLDAMSPHMYKKGQGSEAPRSLYQGQSQDAELGVEKQGSKDPRGQAHQDGMEGGYKDNNLPQTFEGLEQKFIQELMKLTQEQHEAEDKENARHKERLIEINSQYQEKLLAMRAHQATRREEFLRKESQSRHQQYQQGSINGYQPNTGPSNIHGYGSGANAGPLGDPQRGYGGAGNFVESYGERSGYGAGPRDLAYDPRDQYPGGRSFNSRGRGRGGRDRYF